jgi:glycosyltransferase involved in cell wall biosynthesis/ubiquinone/menaquinone biosynthesis C-methylase UbiE
MPVRDEADTIERSLSAVLAQDYPSERMEVIVVDGASRDNTIEIVKHCAQKGPFPVYVLHNPEGFAPSSLNLGIKRSSGSVVVRVDGHCEIQPDYVRRCVDALEATGADNVGGVQEARGSTYFERAFAAATTSRFGVGDARFRYASRAGWVDTVYLGAYRRDVFLRVGMFDEELVRNQDDEFNLRLRQAGGRIWLDPSIRTAYRPRSSLAGLWRQYYEYGLYKPLVYRKRRTVGSWRSLAPSVFVVALAAATVATLVARRFQIIGAVGGLYLLAGAASALFAAWRSPGLIPAILLAFPVLHVSYGLGFLVGVWRWRHRTEQEGAGPAPTEVQRLRRVYEGYGADPRYSKRWDPGNRGNALAREERRSITRRLLGSLGVFTADGCRVLDAGCGRGEQLADLFMWGLPANKLVGVDLMMSRLKEAVEAHPEIAFINADATRLPFPDGCFRIVLFSTVFSSILDAGVRRDVAAEADRVLAPGGAIVWYDFRLSRPFNPHTRAMRRAEIMELFRGFEAHLSSVTVNPFIARRLGPLTNVLYPLLRRVSPLRSHNIGVLIKKG